MSLPESWVEKIFTKLALVYGHQFLSRWDGLDVADVKADWAHELRGFAQNPKAIAYGLDHLPPGKAPTVLEFRAICNSPLVPQAERPLALPRTLEREDAASRHQVRLKRVRADNPGCGGYDWALALELKDREEPNAVTPTARAMYRDALAIYRGWHRAPEALSSEEAPWQ